MKIGSFDNSPKNNIQPAGARDGKAAGATPPEASAKVELSSAAALLAQQEGADFDAAKVERIAQAIREGKFEVNAEAIADKLLASTRELLVPRGNDH
ncbi:MAG TPA: flagellar biosynthesis anti-sigma factor FlgM [Burkholderiaceae bacterium]|nr:flagellar biosynthesis anti-sigma factor FlgM [Burkholderiaceae bacterium]